MTLHLYLIIGASAILLICVLLVMGIMYKRHLGCWKYKETVYVTNVRVQSVSSEGKLHLDDLRNDGASVEVSSANADSSGAQPSLTWKQNSSSKQGTRPSLTWKRNSSSKPHHVPNNSEEFMFEGQAIRMNPSFAQSKTHAVNVNTSKQTVDTNHTKRPTVNMKRHSSKPHMHYIPDLSREEFKEGGLHPHHESISSNRVKPNNDLKGACVQSKGHAINESVSIDENSTNIYDEAEGFDNQSEREEFQDISGTLSKQRPDIKRTEDMETVRAAQDDHKAIDEVIEIKHLHKELNLMEMIGKGFFGKVWKAMWNGDCVAVKMYHGTATINPTVMRRVSKLKSTGSIHGKNMFSNEHRMTTGTLHIHTDDEGVDPTEHLIEEMRNVTGHPNLLRILGICRFPLCTVTEYMGGGSVQALVYGLTDKAIPAVDEKLYILLKSCAGLRHLSQERLYHRNIAARNILLSEFDDKIDESTMVKICDFGMNTKDDDGDIVNEATTAKAAKYKWMAPESIQNNVYNEKTDVYMFGITMWEIMYGKEPFEEIEPINVAMRVCFGNERPKFKSDLPSGMKMLIEECWKRDPDERPTFDEIHGRLQRMREDAFNEAKEVETEEAEMQ